MKSIIWMSNLAFDKRSSSINRTGTWLQPLIERLADDGRYKIHNLAFADVNELTRCDFGKIEQWLIPERSRRCSDYSAAESACKQISAVVSKVQPDLAHIWGTEDVWASAYRKGYIPTKTLLEIQGLLYAYTDTYYGGLHAREILQCIGLKEVIMPWRTLYGKKAVFKKRGEEELRCLSAMQYIGCPSQWVLSHLRHVNERFEGFIKPYAMREIFELAAPWKSTKNRVAPVIFTSCSAAVPYKGLHILLKAVATLKRKFGGIQLRIAGNFNVGNRLMDGYSRFLNSQIKQLGLANNVVILGPCTGEMMISELTNCDICVVPSFVETYCLALAEALALGVPTVVAFSGAMPELARHNEEALFYNPTDSGQCASLIKQLFEDRELATTLSQNARKRILKQGNGDLVLSKQIEIYEKILS